MTNFTFVSRPWEYGELDPYDTVIRMEGYKMVGFSDRPKKFVEYRKVANQHGVCKFVRKDER